MWQIMVKDAAKNPEEILNTFIYKGTELLLPKSPPFSINALLTWSWPSIRDPITGPGVHVLPAGSKPWGNSLVALHRRYSPMEVAQR